MNVATGMLVAGAGAAKEAELLAHPKPGDITSGVLLHAIRMGHAGPRLVFCHGLFGQARNFATLAKRFSDRYRVILLDMPNHGRSAWVDTVDYVQMADQVAGFIDREGPARVIGHSMGAKIAMLAALRHPRLVDKLVVIDMSPVKSRTVLSFDTYTSAMQAIDLSTLQSRHDAEDQLAVEVPDPVIRQFLLQNLRRAQGWHWQLNLGTLAAQLPALGEWPDTTAMTFPGPVLWMIGENSTHVDPSDRTAMRLLFPQTRTVTIKGAGHWVHADQPEACYQVLDAFLKTHPTGSRP